MRYSNIVHVTVSLRGAFHPGFYEYTIFVVDHSSSVYVCE